MLKPWEELKMTDRQLIARCRHSLGRKCATMTHQAVVRAILRRHLKRPKQVASQQAELARQLIEEMGAAHDG